MRETGEHMAHSASCRRKCGKIWQGEERASSAEEGQAGVWTYVTEDGQEFSDGEVGGGGGEGRGPAMYKERSVPYSNKASWHK